MASRNPKRNVILAILVISLSLGICYVKLKFFLRPKEDLYKQTTTSRVQASTSPSLGTEAISEATTTPQIFQGTIHVVLSVDTNDFPAVPTMLNSLKQHSNSQLVVHILVTGDVHQLKSLIDCCKLNDDLEVDFQEFQLPSDFKDIITVTGTPSIYGNISSVANFARFFLHKLFPSLTHILYLDVDSVVQHDITDLWLQVIDGDQLITSTTIPHRTYGTYLKPMVKDIFDKRHSKSLDMSTPCIIGGLYGVNLELWKKLDVEEEVIFWMKEHHKHHLWELGSQPLLMLVSYNRLKIVSQRWNLTGLGWNKKYSLEELSKWFILHWNGKNKPWLKDGLYKEAWNHFTPELFDECMKDIKKL